MATANPTRGALCSRDSRAALGPDLSRLGRSAWCVDALLRAAAEAKLRVSDRAFAELLDQRDPLAPLRNEFDIPTLGSVLGDAAPGNRRARHSVPRHAR